MKQTIPKIIRHYDKKAETTGEWREESPIWKIVDDLKLRWIKSHLSRKGRVLDAGGGSGIWTIKLAKMGFEVCLVDISKTLLESAKNKINKEGVIKKVQIYESNIEKLPFPPNYFDYVLCEGDVLGITPNINRALKELHRVLKKDGILLANFVNYYKTVFFRLEKNINEYEQFIKNPMEYIPAFQTNKAIEKIRVKVFKPKELEKIFKRHNFKVLDMKPEICFADVAFYKDNFKQLKDKKILNKILKLERKCFNEEIVPLGGHILISVRK